MASIPQRDRREAKPTLWGRATSELIAAAGITQASVAEAAGISKQYLNNLLSGRREPLEKTASSINRAVATLADNRRIEDALHLEAVASDFIERDGAALVRGAFRILRWYATHFKSDGLARILDYMGALDEQKLVALTLGLNRVLLRISIAELLPASTPVGFGAVLDVLEESGLDLAHVVDSERSAPALAVERFRWSILRELARANPSAPASERLVAVQRILAPFNDPDVAPTLLKGLAPVVRLERMQAAPPVHRRSKK